MTQPQEQVSEKQKKHSDLPPRNPSNPKTREEGESRFGTAHEEDEAEINPDKLEKSELKTDVEGSTGEKGHQPYDI